MTDSVDKYGWKNSLVLQHFECFRACDVSHALQSNNFHIGCSLDDLVNAYLPIERPQQADSASSGT